jgi:signal transduction histidine kinase
MVCLDRLYVGGEMAAGIAHGIQNPMTVVSGYLQLFQEKVKFASYKRL